MKTSILHLIKKSYTNSFISLNPIMDSVFSVYLLGNLPGGGIGASISVNISTQTSMLEESLSTDISTQLSVLETTISTDLSTQKDSLSTAISTQFANR